MSIHVDHVLSISQIPEGCILQCSGRGDVSAFVVGWRKTLDFTVDREKAIDCLVGYGAWDREDLDGTDDNDIAEKILWLACSNFAEWDGTEDSPCGSDIFVLE